VGDSVGANVTVVWKLPLVGFVSARRAGTIKVQPKRNRYLVG